MSFLITLIAYILSLNLAKYTFPKVPFPNKISILKSFNVGGFFSLGLETISSFSAA
jgi:hypothetical protein